MQTHVQKESMNCLNLTLVTAVLTSFAACDAGVNCPGGTVLDEKTEICVDVEPAEGGPSSPAADGSIVPEVAAPVPSFDASMVAPAPVPMGSLRDAGEMSKDAAARSDPSARPSVPMPSPPSERKPEATPGTASGPSVPTPPMPPACVAEAEICDGKDNNCNGQVDEGWSIKVDVATSSSPFGGGATRPTVNRWVGSRCYQPCVGEPSYSVRGKFRCDVAKREMACGSLELGCVPMGTSYGEDDPPGLFPTYPVRN